MNHEDQLKEVHQKVRQWTLPEKKTKLAMICITMTYESICSSARAAAVVAVESWPLRRFLTETPWIGHDGQQSPSCTWECFLVDKRALSRLINVTFQDQHEEGRTWHHESKAATILPMDIPEGRSRLSSVSHVTKRNDLPIPHESFFTPDYNNWIFFTYDLLENSE